MPVPCLFEASGDPREQWAHVLSILLTLAGPDTRSALVEEITGEALPDTDAMLVRAQRPLRDTPDRLLADTVARGAGWTFAVQATLAFGVVDAERLAATYDVLDEVADRTILVSVTPDRRPPEELERLVAEGRDVRHRSWLRVRDWVQERPERGRAEGVDLLLLREAEYYLTPRVAELYRLEGVMPLLPSGLRPAFAAAFFDLNEVSPAPLLESGSPTSARIVFPRTGEPVAEVVVEEGALAVRLLTPQGGPATTTEGAWQVMLIGEAADYYANRAWVQATARAVLPARR